MNKLFHVITPIRFLLRSSGGRLGFLKAKRMFCRQEATWLSLYCFSTEQFHWKWTISWSSSIKNENNDTRDL